MHLFIDKIQIDEIYNIFYIFNFQTSSEWCMKKNEMLIQISFNF